MADYFNDSGFYEQSRESYFNDKAQREADAAYEREKGWESIKAQDEADRAAAYKEQVRRNHMYRPTPSESEAGPRSHSHRTMRQRVENPRWLGVALFLVIFAAEIVSLHVTTVNGYGWNSGGGVIVLGLLAWLATFLTLKMVLLLRFIMRQGRH